jgi:branched-chain amino acid transport system substrate-binding protein
VLRAPEGQEQRGGTAYHTMSTGISYALVDKTAEDKVPLVMIGYGRPMPWMARSSRTRSRW